MKFICTEYHKQGTKLSDIMLMAGHEIDIENPDVMLIDHTAGFHYKNLLGDYPDAVVIEYAHGEGVNVTYDGIYTPSKRTALHLATSEEQAHVMRLYGYSYPIEVIGWYLTEQEEFKPSYEKKPRVLFVPIHPGTGNGWMHPTHEVANSVMYTKLLSLDIDLTVRYLGNLDSHGLWDEPSVKFIRGRPGVWDQGYDLTITYNKTYLAGCVALGMPVAAYAQHYPWFESRSQDHYQKAKNWDLYKQYVRYPYSLDTLHHDSLMAMMRTAMSTEASDWRKRWIGNQIDKERFVKLVEDQAR